MFEHSEFARRRSRQHGAGHPKGHATATMVLGPFAETKGPRPPGRKPAIDIKKAPVHFLDKINLAQGNRHGIHDGRTSSDDLDLKDAFL